MDTNVLLRFLLADDPEQFEIAKTFVSMRSVDDPAFVSLVVVAEMAWVLKRRYRFTNEDIIKVLRQLLPSEQFLFEDEDRLYAMVEDDLMVHTDLSDRIIAYLANRHGAHHTVTFDRAAAKSIAGTELLA